MNDRTINPESMKSLIRNTLSDSARALREFIQDDEKVDAVSDAASLLIQTLKSGNAIYSCGNGGSMSDAMHFAEELTGRFRDNRGGLPATAISDPGHLSCVANDFGYEYVFSRYLEARARPGDALLAISTSGTSKNVVRAAQYAKDNNIQVVSLTGKPESALGVIANVDVNTIVSKYADRVQELHIKIIHVLIEMIEREFFPENYSD